MLHVERKIQLLCYTFKRVPLHILVIQQQFFEVNLSFSQLKKMEESHQEATEKEVERILRILQTHFEDDRKYG